MTNEKINATVEEIMEYEALLDEVKGIVDGLKDNLKNEMAERKVESLSTDRYSQMDRSSYFQVQLQGI